MDDKTQELILKIVFTLCLLVIVVAIGIKVGVISLKTDSEISGECE